MHAPTPVPAFLSVILLAGLLLCACSPTAIDGGDITVEPGTTILAGQQAHVKIDVTVKGAPPRFTWSAGKGRLLNPDAPSAIYTAPNSAGPDTVTVVVTAGDATFTRSVAFDVVLVTPTPAGPEATGTPTAVALPAPATPTPPPTPVPAIACNHPSVTANVFPRLGPVAGQFPFYGLLDDPNFECQGVYDRFHTGPMAVRLAYTNHGKNYGFWGIGTPSGFDASRFTRLCFWVYVELPNQAFRLKLRDTSGTEKGVLLNVDRAGEWSQVCTALVEVSAQGVRLERLVNINLGFEQPSGSAVVWVDDFELH